MARFALVVVALLLLGLSGSPNAWAVGALASPPQPERRIPDLEIRHQGLRALMVREPATLAVTLWLELRHAGVAKEFGWLLPLPKAPKVSLGSAILFDLLDARMAPRHLLAEVASENCRDPLTGCKGPAKATSDAGGKTPDGGGGLGPYAAVQVAERGQSGPLSWQVIASKSASALQSWLTKNDFELAAGAASVVADHVAAGDVFLAVKMTNNATTDLVRPLVLEMAAVPLRLPMRLSALTAANDMPLVLTIAGPGRAVVKNLMNVRINPLRLDVLRRAANYDEALREAVDEAAGRAFVTEFAGHPKTAGSIVSDAALDLKELATATDLRSLAVAVGGLDPLWWHAEVAALFEKHLGLKKLLADFAPPSAAAALGILATCGRAWSAGSPGGCALPEGELPDSRARAVKIKPKTLVAALGADIATALRRARDLIDSTSAVTRLSTRISGPELDRDPVFAFNAQLPDVHNVHIWPSWPVCRNGWLPAAGTRVDYAPLGSWIFEGVVDGDNYLGVSSTTDPRFAQAPWALALEVLDESGSKPRGVHPADVLLVDGAIIDAMPGVASIGKDVDLRDVEPWQPPGDDAPLDGLGDWPAPPGCEPKDGWRDGYPPPDGPADDDGCTVGRRRAPWPPLMALFLVLCALSFKRHRSDQPGAGPRLRR